MSGLWEERVAALNWDAEDLQKKGHVPEWNPSYSQDSLFVVSEVG